MESLRWILLAAGIAFIVIIYFLGRSRRQRNRSMVDDLTTDDLENELPEFAARNLDDVDEGVGQVKIVTSAPDDVASFNATEEEQYSDATDTSSHEELENTSSTATSSAPKDIIVLYVLPKPAKNLIGSQINSSAQAMGLKFGEMNIFHYMDNNRSVFSMANMLEPGSFNADTMHDLKTTGLTLFMQIHKDDPLDDLTEMLQRSYQLAGLLDARLCNHKREPLTEQDAENYRTQVSDFIASRANSASSELSSET